MANHKFLIDIFERYNEVNSNSELWLFGTGELENQIKQYVHEKKLQNKVKFMGVRSDINKIYSAIDCYVFPSLFEGMPNTVIEAQTSGLPCLVSDKITSDCNITNDVKFLSLNADVDEWVSKIHMNSDEERKEKNLLIKNNKYDINDVVDDIVKIIFG